MMRFRVCLLLSTLCLLLGSTVSAFTFSPRFVAEPGLFLQGVNLTAKPSDAGFQLPNFGAVQPWEQIHHRLNFMGQCGKLLFLIRHGEGVHNLVLSIVGYDMWQNVVSKQCWYQDYHIFDPSLTHKGRDQAAELNSMLKADGTLQMLLTGHKMQVPEGMHARKPLVLASPLSRTTETAIGVFEGIDVLGSKILAFEHAREFTEGSHPCDARRSVSDPETEGVIGNCTFDKGYESIYGNQRMAYPMMTKGQGFGLYSDKDEYWSKDFEETHNTLNLRAAGLVQSLFDNFVEENVMFVVLHSGSLSAVLETAGLKEYEAANAELVPILIRDRLCQISDPKIIAE